VYHYYHCTFKSKITKCSQNRFLREEELRRQVQSMCQEVSLPDVWKERYLTKLNAESAESRHSAHQFVQNLKNDISDISNRLERLTDAYLAEALELSEYTERKNKLTSEKRTQEEQLRDFERKGTQWLELMRNWILEANQAAKLSQTDNFDEMRNFLQGIGSNRRIAAGILTGEFKMPWHFLAEMPVHTRGSAACPSDLGTNQIWWT
jgi:hypothetical protein